MLLNVEDDLIQPARETLVIDNEIEEFLETNEGKNIR